MRIIIILDSLKRDSILCLKIAELILEDLKNEFINLEVFIAQTGSDFVRFALNSEKTIILHNFTRINNQKNLKKLAQFGVKNFVLDTEGFPFWIFKSGITSRKLLCYVDKYFTWGSKQKDYINNISSTNIAVQCGSYRHQKIKKIKINDENRCLVITSSPIANPLFESREASILVTKKASRLSNKDLNKVVEEQEIIIKNIGDLLPLLSSHFKEVLIRVHPFENKKIYREYSRNLLNIKFSENQNLLDDFKFCSTVLHGYSTAGVEAYLSGKRIFVTKKSENLPNFLEKYLSIVSIGSQSIDQKNFKKIINNYNLDSDVKNVSKKELDKYYGLNIKSIQGIKIIKETMMNEFSSKDKFHLRNYLKRIIALKFLQLRKILGFSPKPKTLKKIFKKDFHQIIITEGIKLTLKELENESGVWKASQ